MLLQLFWSFLQVGLFAVGGGYAAMPLIQAQVVTVRAWLSLSEFTDLVTIAEMTPGPIAINAATFVGMRVAGPLGALVATFACILPPCVIVSLLAMLYRRCRRLPVLQSVLACLRPAVVALIASAGWTIWKLVATDGAPFRPENASWIGLILFEAALFLLRKLKWNPILVMLLCGAARLAVFELAHI